MTDENNKREIKVGITVLTGIILFIIVVMWAKNFSFDSGEQIVKVKFPNVSGLYVKDKVTVNGVEKGYVSDLKIDGNTVVAELTLSGDVDLRKDASFGIVMLDLMGGKKVEIKPGIAAAKLNLNEIHHGKFKGDISEAMSLFNEMQTDLSDIIRQTKEITDAMSKILKEENLSEEIFRSLSSLNLTLEKTNDLLAENGSDIRKITRNGAELTDSLKLFWKENSANLTRFVEKSNAALERTDSVLAAMNDLLQVTNAGSNNLGKILNDENYLSELKKTLENLNELTRILTEQLKGEGINVKTNIF